MNVRKKKELKIELKNWSEEGRKETRGQGGENRREEGRGKDSSRAPGHQNGPLRSRNVKLVENKEREMGRKEGKGGQEETRRARPRARGRR